MFLSAGQLASLPAQVEQATAFNVVLLTQFSSNASPFQALALVTSRRAAPAAAQLKSIPCNTTCKLTQNLTIRRIFEPSRRAGRPHLREKLPTAPVSGIDHVRTSADRPAGPVASARPHANEIWVSASPELERDGQEDVGVAEAARPRHEPAAATSARGRHTQAHTNTHKHTQVCARSSSSEALISGRPSATEAATSWPSSRLIPSRLIPSRSVPSRPVSASLRWLKNNHRPTRTDSARRCHCSSINRATICALVDGD